jgi:hypothetical protein
MLNIIWISKFNEYLIKNNINLDMYDYIDYIADKVGHNFNNNFIKYLLKLDQMNSNNTDLENNKYCISSYEFDLLHIKKDKDIKKILKKTNLKINRDYIIKYHNKRFLYFFNKKKKIFYLHPYAFKMCLLSSGLFPSYFIIYERIFYNYYLYKNQILEKQYKGIDNLLFSTKNLIKRNKNKLYLYYL